MIKLLRTGFPYAVILLTLASFWRILGFGFWKDDWSVYWGTLHNNWSILRPYILHPGTIIEFEMFAGIFGLRFMLWQALGLLFRVAGAWAVMLFVGGLVRWPVAGIVAGLFFAASYAGMESMHFVSGHVTAVSQIFVCLTGYAYVRKLRYGQGARLFWILLTGTLAMDPGRTAPLLFLLPVIRLVERKKIAFHLHRFTLVLIVLFGIASARWFWVVLDGTMPQKAAVLLWQDPALFAQKLKLAGNYFAAIANLGTGWVVPMPQDAHNTGQYHWALGRLGVALFVFSCIALFGLRTLIRRFRLAAFFVLWMFVFYAPNWLFEPRAPMAGPHRYLLLSSVGLAGLVGLAFSHLRSRAAVGVGFVVLTTIIARNVWLANEVLRSQSSYRGVAVVSAYWATVNRAVPMTPGPFLFSFAGEQPYVSHALELTGGYPFALSRGITDRNGIPVITNYMPKIMAFVCAPRPTDRAQSIVRVYGWTVLPAGELVDSSEQLRRVIRGLVDGGYCGG